MLGEEALRALGERLQVGPGAKRLGALAGEHEDARLVVGLEAVEAVEELGRGRVVHGVAALGPGDREHGGGAVALVARRRHCVTLRDRASRVHRARPDAEAEKKPAA